MVRSRFKVVALRYADSLRGHSQVGSLAGAVHLLKDNAGVPRCAQ